MYLSKLHIKNFRSITSCELNFNAGLNVIVGENNIGKSTVIDALRLLLPNVDQPNFNITDLDIGKNANEPIELKYIFDGLTLNEEAIFIEALVPYEQRFQAHFHVILRLGKYAPRLTSEKWCGAHNSERIPSGILEELISVYLPPLRNPAEGLKPGYGSQIARLVKIFSSDEDQANLEKIVKEFDKELKKQPPILDAEKAVNSKINNITGEDLSQQVELSFSGNEFKKILARLAIFVDNMEVEQNGLGYNNIIYTAAVLSQLKKENEATYRGLLIEEPEAHLHPQLQTLLLQHLVKQINTNNSEPTPEVQVIVTSHSPIFASKAPLDSIVSLHSNGSNLNCVNIANLDISKREKRKIERFLDATRAELFFAKKLIMVEGISEALLVPLFAKRIGFNLNEKSVSIVNVQGLNFLTFLELLKEKGIKIPCAIITDSDPAEEVYPQTSETPDPSEAAKKLKEKETDLIKVFLAKKTLEYDLGLNVDNLPTLISAFKKLHPGIGSDLENKIRDSLSDSEKTKLFFQSFTKSCKSKGEFSQELAMEIEEKESTFIVPPYILEAIKHVVGSEKKKETPTTTFLVN